MKKIIYIYLILISACNSKQVNYSFSNKKITTNLLKEIKLKISDSSNYNFLQTELFETDSGTILFAYDRNRKCIYFYNLLEDKLLKKSKLKTEGVNSFNQLPFSFTVVSKDSIYTLQQQPIVLYRLNSSCKIYEKIEILNSLPNGEETAIAGSGITDPVIIDKESNTICFWVMYANSIKEHYYSANSAIYNLNEKKYNFLFSEFPPPYKEAVNKNKWFSNKENLIRTKVNNKIIYSYQISDYLYIYDYINGNCLDSIYAKSSFINKEIEALSIDANIQEEENNFNTEPNYVNIIYDKYRSIYLRVVKHRQDLRNNDGKLNKYLNSEWSIMFFDKYFKFIDEIKFQKNIYNFKEIFITKSGIAISKNNPFNNSQEEGLLKYDIFKITLK